MRRDRIQLQPTPGRVIAAAQPLEAVTFGLVGQGQPPSWSCRIWCYRSFSRNRPGAGSLAAPLNHNAMNDSAGGCSAVASHHASWEGKPASLPACEPGASGVPGSIIQDLRRSSSCSLVRSVRCDACKCLSARCHRTR